MIMKVYVDLKNKFLRYDLPKEDLLQYNEIGVTCNVRTLKNGRRTTAVKDVVRAIPSGLPYDPMVFPVGIWHIIAVEWNTKINGKDRFNRWEYGNVKIRTDARQLVDTWELDADGNYLKPAGKQVWDEGYLIHYSDSRTTLGCIRADLQLEIDTFAQYCEEYLKHKQWIPIEVAA